jgi:asparagine synthase (glutamine-hydrolysing)
MNQPFAGSEEVRYRVVPILPTSRKILLECHASRFRAIRIDVGVGVRPVPALRRAIESTWGLQVLILDVVQDRETDSPWALAEVIVERTSLGLERIDIDEITWDEPSDDLRNRLRRVVEGTADCPVSRVGWINSAIAWLEQVTGAQALAKPWIDQYNAGEGFALVRFQMQQGPKHWLKATGEPNRHERLVTRLLSGVGGEALPIYLAEQPAWNAWLMSGDAAGISPLPKHPDLLVETLSGVVQSFASLQQKTIGRQAELFAAGAFDHRLPVLRKAAETVFAFLEEAMGRQTSTKVLALGKARLGEIRSHFERACDGLAGLAVPDTVLHGDLSLDNILVKGDRYQFIDWSETYIGNPLISLEHLLLLNCAEEATARRDVDRQLRDAYCDSMTEVCEPDKLKSAFRYSPLVAAVSAIYGRGRWLNTTMREDSRRQAYARSVARHMDRVISADPLRAVGEMTRSRRRYGEANHRELVSSAPFRLADEGSWIRGSSSHCKGSADQDIRVLHDDRRSNQPLGGHSLCLLLQACVVPPAFCRYSRTAPPLWETSRDGDRGTASSLSVACVDRDRQPGSERQTLHRRDVSSDAPLLNEGAMSIIWGLIKKREDTVAEPEMRRLGDAIVRYGTGEPAVYVLGRVGMGFQQYATDERSTMNGSPLSDAAGNLLSFDGRLDNFHELAEMLDVLALETCDAALVLAAYRRWNEDAFARMTGDWALSLWSSQSQKLFLARDHAGARTLYFQSGPDGFAWSTYLDTFAAQDSLSDLSVDYAASWIAGSAVRGRTPYRNIGAVLPGHYAVLQDDILSQRQHWSPLVRTSIRHRVDEEYEERFLSLFKRSVARRTGPGAPILAQLSGGMDSTAIVCVSDHLRRASDPNAELLDTISFFDDSEASLNERPYFSLTEARRGKSGIHVDVAFAQRTLTPPIGTTGSYLVPGADSFTVEQERNFEDRVWGRGYRSVLSGIGGDEVLGGVPSGYPELADYLATLRLSRLLRSSIAWSLVDRTPLLLTLGTVAGSIIQNYLQQNKATPVCPP